MPESIGVMVGAGAEFPALGKTWKLSPPDQHAKERLEKLAARKALEDVRGLKGVLDRKAYDELFESARKALPTYKTWGDGWQSVVFSAECSHYFLWSLLQGQHPEITEEQVIAIATDSPEEVAAAVSQVLPDFFQVMLAPIRDRLTPEQLATIDATMKNVVEQLRPTATKSN